jgi:methyltransferase (TIGR00027 family)
MGPGDGGTGGGRATWTWADVDGSGPSWTARWVAAHRLDFTRVPAPYGDAAADEALARDVVAEVRVSPGRMHEYLAARTAFFDRIVVGSLARGVRQVVIGGAGYDGRALRYAKPGVRWFEVDHPATQADKRERLDRLGLAAAHVRFVPADFAGDPVADLLLGAGLDATAPGLFLLEGVAVYLEPAVLEQVLDQFRRVAPPGSLLAISLSLSGEYDREARDRFQASVAAMGEPARSAFAADEAEDLLARAGWHVMAGPERPAGPDGPEAAATRDRLRSAGLLTARAAPRTPAPAADASAGAPAPAASGSPRTPAPASAPSASPGTPPPVPGPHPTAPAPAGPVPHSHQPADSLPLSALLSQALVAFTIEFDN